MDRGREGGQRMVDSSNLDDQIDQTRQDTTEKRSSMAMIYKCNVRHARCDVIAPYISLDIYIYLFIFLGKTNNKNEYRVTSLDPRPIKGAT